jgi:cellulose synthase/poly-beta-1,6-N-acetylglucosamine synthase-like glycosyltransferase
MIARELMGEERSTTILFLIFSILVVLALVILLWKYLIVIMLSLGIILFAVLVIAVILGAALLITHLILIPFFAVKHPSELTSGNYSIDDAKEPETDEKINL